MRGIDAISVDRRAGNIMIEGPFNGVSNYGRIWRKDAGKRGPKCGDHLGTVGLRGRKHCCPLSHGRQQECLVFFSFLLALISLSLFLCLSLSVCLSVSLSLSHRAGRTEYGVM